MKTYKYTDAKNDVVHIFDEDGVSRLSCLASAVPGGATIQPADPLTPEQQAAAARIAIDAAERQQAKQDAAIIALVDATPAQRLTYVNNNFPSLTQAERNKFAMILDMLAVALRDKVR